MAWKLPRLQFGLRGLLLLVLACAIGAWLYTNRPERMRAYRNQQARSRIDPYELAIAGEVDPASVPPELVAVLGDSRLKHWGAGGRIKLLAGDQLATSSLDQRVRIWDRNTGRQLHEFPAKTFEVSGDRKLLFLAAADGTIRCWDVATAKVLKTLDEPRTVDSVGMGASGDGKVLVAESVKRDRSREITVWDVPEARVIHSFRPEKTGGGANAVSHDGQFFTWEEEQQVRLSNCATGEVLQTFGPIIDEPGGQCVIGEVEFSADDTKLFVGSALPAVVVFDRASGMELERIGWSGGSVHQFAFGPRERSIIFEGITPLTVHRFDGQWKRWEAAAGSPRRIANVDWHESIIAAHTHDGLALWRDRSGLLPWRIAGGSPRAIRRLAFHPDGRHLLTGDSAGQVEVWEVAGWKPVRRWTAHEAAIKRLAISADGSRLVTADDQQSIAVWDAGDGRELCVIRGVFQAQGVGISPNGRQVVAGLRDRMFGDEFEIYDATTGDTIRKAGPIKHGILSPPAWSPDGQRVAFMDQTRSLQIFDTATWKKIGSVGNTRFGQKEVVAVWLSDNRRLITTNWGYDEIHLLEVGKAAPVLTLRVGVGQGRCVAVHPSEEWIAVCGYKMPVQLWHLPTGKLIKSWQIGPPAGLVSQVAFSPDGHYLATVNGNGTVYVLSLDGVLD